MCERAQAALCTATHLLSCCRRLLLLPVAGALGSCQVSCPGWWRRSRAAAWLCLCMRGGSQLSVRLAICK